MYWYSTIFRELYKYLMLECVEESIICAILSLKHNLQTNILLAKDWLTLYVELKWIKLFKYKDNISKLVKHGSGKIAFTSEFFIHIQIYYSLYDLAFIRLFKYFLWGRYNDNVSFCSFLILSSNGFHFLSLFGGTSICWFSFECSYCKKSVKVSSFFLVRVFPYLDWIRRFSL